MKRAMRQMGPLGAGLGLLTLLVLAGGLFGCKEKDKEKYRLQFSHYLHVTENEIGCEDCHGDATAGGYKKLSHETCIDCHDEPDAEEITEETCGICHRASTREEIEFAVKEKTRSPSRVFVHTEFMEGKCEECHGALMAEGLTSVPKMNRSDVIRKRDEWHAKRLACDKCHVGMDPAVPPESHRADWTLRHGQFGIQEDAACTMCHTENSCRECHAVTQPANHSILWRTKIHGIQASWDRESCRVCHEPDTCNTCHEEVRPRSHNAAWRQGHCFQCHTSQAGGQGCVVCHQDGLIDSHPNPHTAGWRSRHCDSCHPGTPQAESCQVCHPGGFDQHPSPHPGGWRSRHCDSCHEDSPQRDKCNLCHETNLKNHGNPHRGNWRQNHCDNCHAGSSSASDCGRCHAGAGSVLVHESFWPPVHNRFGDKVGCDLCHF